MATVTASGAGMLMGEDPQVGGSDTDGNFTLSGLRAGTYHVAISDYPEAIEFPVTTRDVTVGVGLSANVSFSAPGEDQPTDPGDDTGAFVFVSDVSDAVDDEVYSGQVTVTASVERGTARFEKLTLYVDDVEVDSQEFGGPASAPGDAEGDDPELAAQQVIEFELGFNSEAYDESGNPAYMNGDHTLSVGLQIAGGQTLMSNEVTNEFANDDGIHVNAVAPEESVLDSDGDTWYGGPGTALSVTVVPVLYSGSPLTAVTMKSFCGADAETIDAEPFEFTPDCEKKGKTSKGATPDFTLTVGGGDAIAVGAGDFLNGDSDIFPINLDYQGPDAPRFHPNPNERQGGWVNLAVDFLGKQGKNNKDGWLVHRSDAGVGGYTPQLRFSTTTPSVVDGAIAVGPVEGVPVLPAGGTKANAVCVVATAVDKLGNESGLPSSGTACANAVAYKAAVDVLTAAVEDENDDDIAEAWGDIPAGIRAGLDILPPTIKFSGTSPTKNDRNLSSQFQLQVADAGGSTGKSGLHEDPVLARVEIRDEDNEVTYGDDDADKMDLPGNETLLGVCENTTDGLAYDEVLDLVTTSGLPTTGPAYYTLTAMGRDKAGNHSEPVSRVALNDGTEAQVLIGGAYDPKKAVHNLIISVTDDFSIRDYYVAITFAEIAGGPTGDEALPTRFRLMDPVAVDEYNSAELTQSAPDASGSYNAFVALQGTDVTTVGDDDVHGLEDSDAFTATDDRTVAVYARDQSEGNKAYSSSTDDVDNAFLATDGFPEATAPNTDTEMVTGGIESFTFEPDDDEYDVEDTIELTAEVVGFSRDAKGVLVIGDDDTDEDTADDDPEDLAAEDAVPFLNPFKRVDFYAVSTGPTDETTDDELRFIASVGATGTRSEVIDEDDDGVDDAKDENATAGTFDTTEDEKDDGDGTQTLTITEERANADNKVTFSYSVEVSAADFYAAVQDSGKGDYGTTTNPGRVIAIGVSVDNAKLTADGGVGLVSQAAPITIDK